ncbi:hypothetical protein D9M71_809600 [compost metagenome]
MPWGRRSKLALSANTATSSELAINMTFDHHGSLGSSSSASQVAKTRYQPRDRRVWVKRATPIRNNQWASTSRPLANQIPISSRPLMRSRARAIERINSVGGSSAMA